MTKPESDKYRILIVEDEENLATALEYNLQAEGYQVQSVNDGKKAVDAFALNEFDLIILDIMLPRIDGFEVLKRIRPLSAQVPVLILTARTSPPDKLRGLELGADDYLTKPFHLQELLLRVKGMLKRKEWYRVDLGEIKEFTIGNFKVDLNSLSARSEQKSFRMTLLEASLLKYLLRNENRIVSREELLVNVWNIDSDTETRTPENFIMRLRKYFEPNPAKPVYFRTVRGLGYIFNQKGR